MCPELCLHTLIGMSSFNYGRCYLKNALGSLSDNGGVWTAKRAGATTAPTVPTPEIPETLSCVDNKDDTKTRGNFTIQCGNDHAGADIGSASGTSFEQCIDTCNANSECQAVSWVWGTCYMKNAVNDGQTGISHVWGAARTSALIPAPVAEPETTPSSPAEVIVTPSAAVETPSTPTVDTTPTAVVSITVATPSMVLSTPVED
jgi:hypothetical protein